MATEAKRCAIYTRKSSEEGLEQAFNSLDAQREACAAYIESQRHEGWKALQVRYDDGGFSGGSLERPALRALLKDIGDGKVDVVVVYKVDRLTRSLADFAKIVELFDHHAVSFVSVTQQFNTTSSMGRLTLNVLLSFAQFEREVTGERIRDKIAASKKKGMWMGGYVPLGYDLADRKLTPNEEEAKFVRRIYERYLALGCVRKLQGELKELKLFSKSRIGPGGRRTGGVPYSRGALYSILQNRLYLGEISHRGLVHPGQHEAIVPRMMWEQVRARLKANSDARRSGASAKAPSLLAGMLFDAAGHRLTPIHTTKRKKRYRYYASQDVIRNGPQASDQPLRIPAYDIERLVLGRLCNFLESKREMLDALSDPDDSASTQQAHALEAPRLASRFKSAAISVSRPILATIVARIVVAHNSVAIHVSMSGLRHVLAGKERSPDDKVSNRGDTFELNVPAQFKRLSGAVRMIVAPLTVAPVPVANEALIKAIARGRRWYEMLISGEVASVQALARITGLNQSYISRVLRCAFLAPDVVQAILDGRQPPHLTLDALFRRIPISWKEQTTAFS